MMGRVPLRRLSRTQRESWPKEKVMFNDRGDTELRGFEDPVRVYEVRWREEA